VSNLDTLLEEIDTATAETCAQCDAPLDGSPSAYWCSQDCQEDWNALRAHALVGYREPLWEWATLGPSPEDFEDYLTPTLSLFAGMANAVALTGNCYIRFDPDLGASSQGRLNGIEGLPPAWELIGTTTGSIPIRITHPTGVETRGHLTAGWSFTYSVELAGSITWSADSAASDAFAAALRPNPDQVAERHIEVCGDCSSRPDVDRHAARLGVEVVDLNQDSALSWPLHSMRTVVPEPQPPELTELTPALPVLPTSGPQQRHRAPRTLGRPR
jgi:hypothetical protein